MLARLGHKVLRLRRLALGPVLLGKLPRGKSRRLTHEEVEALRQAARPAAPRRGRPARRDDGAGET
jgi:23S rRNA pseudouridine2605 synthase